MIILFPLLLPFGVYPSDSHSESSRPAASASLGNLSEMQSLSPNPQTLDQNLWDRAQQSV